MNIFLRDGLARKWDEKLVVHVGTLMMTITIQEFVSLSIGYLLCKSYKSPTS